MNLFPKNRQNLIGALTSYLQAMQNPEATVELLESSKNATDAAEANFFSTSATDAGALNPKTLKASADECATPWLP